MQIDPRTIRDPQVIGELRSQGLELEEVERLAQHLGIPVGAARSVFCQTITGTPSNGAWCRLKRLELDPLGRDPLDVNPHAPTFTLSAQELYTDEYLDYLERELDIWISHVQVFHKWGTENPRELHTDSSDWGSQAAINYVVGPDTGTMRWYDPEHCTATGEHATTPDDRSVEYTTTREPTHVLEHIGSTPTLVRTDVPHTVTTHQERVCVSWRLLNRSTWQSHVDLLAPLL